MAIALIWVPDTAFNTQPEIGYSEKMSNPTLNTTSYIQPEIGYCSLYPAGH